MAVPLFNDILSIHQIKDSAANLKDLTHLSAELEFYLQTDESIDKMRPAILFIFN